MIDLRFFITVGTLVVFFILEGIFPHYKGRAARIKHALPNIVLGLVSALVTGISLNILCNSIIPICGGSVGILSKIDLPVSLKYITSFLIMDLWIYSWHRFNHVNGFLWKFHKVHHADTKMDSTTGVLFHPIELIIAMFFRTIVIMLLGVPLKALLVYDILFISIVVFHHSNIGLPESWDKALRVLTVTPKMHRMHHSAAYEDGNSNFSTVFSFWDRLAKTFKINSGREEIKLGVNGISEDVQKDITKMLLLPWKIT